jgi:hypothetical protein
MEKFLSTSGLSMSKAQSISNICNQRAKYIDSLLTNVNNVSKYFKQSDGEIYMKQIGKPLPVNVLELLMDKSSYHALQAYLMEAVKYKDNLLEIEKYNLFTTELEHPISPKYIQNIFIKEVDEKWGWEQLTEKEYSEYLEAETYASHIGQYFHKNGVLDNLRKNYNTDLELSFIELKKDEKIPVTSTPNHTEKELIDLHENLANVHREYEQKVNYYKAKVKNLVSSKNITVSKLNSDVIAMSDVVNKKLRQEYDELVNDYSNKLSLEKLEFNKNKEMELNRISSLKINIPSNLQATVDKILKDINMVDKK